MLEHKRPREPSHILFVAKMVMWPKDCLDWKLLADSKEKEKSTILSLWQAWEGHAYEYGLKNLHLMGYPVHGLSFDNDLVDSHSLIPHQFHRTSPNV